MDEVEAQSDQTEPSTSPSGWWGRARTWLRERPAYVLLVAGVILFTIVQIGQVWQSDSLSPLEQKGPIDAGPMHMFVTYPAKLVRDDPNQVSQTLSVWLVYTNTLPFTPTTYFIGVEPITNGVAFVNQDGKPITPRLALTPTHHIPVLATLRLRQIDLVEDSSSPVQLTVRVVDAQGDKLGSKQFSIHLESSWAAFWRRLWQRLLSPATPLLTLAAGLVAWAVQEYRRAGERRLEAERKQREHEFQSQMQLEERHWQAEQERLKEARRAARKARQRRENERKLKEQEARLTEVGRIRTLVPGRLAEAVKLHSVCLRQTETDPEWQTSTIMDRLNSIWAFIQEHPWQRAVLDEAASLINEKRYGEAAGTIDLLKCRDAEHPGVKALSVVIEMAQTEPGLESVAAGTYSADEIARAVQWAHQWYGDRLSEIIDQALINLSSTGQSKARQIHKELEKSRVGQRLLNKLHGVDWPHLWPAAPHLASSRVAAWLDMMALSFNPFGPEAAELDSRLPWYVIDYIYEGIRGPQPTALLGAPGSGKTAAALMLAYSCTHPPARPREQGAFPVYYRLPSLPALHSDTSTVLAPLARATARELLRYLSLWPDRLQSLPTYRQNIMRSFVTLAYADSTALLAAEASRLPPSLKDRLAPPTAWQEWSSLPSLQDQDWLDLLAETLPADFERYYWLVDLPNLGGQIAKEAGESNERNPALAQLQQIVDRHFGEEELVTLCFQLGVEYDNLPAKGKSHKARELVRNLERRGRVLKLVELVEQQRSEVPWGNQLDSIKQTLSQPATYSPPPSRPGPRTDRRLETLTDNLQSLVELSMPLAWAQVSLKLFVPYAMRSAIGELFGGDVMRLVWWEEDLKRMVNDRIGQAGGASLSALCGPGMGPDFETAFIRAAQSSPRRLIRLGNALLERAARHPRQPAFTQKDWEDARKSVETNSLV